MTNGDETVGDARVGRIRCGACGHGRIVDADLRRWLRVPDDAREDDLRAVVLAVLKRLRCSECGVARAEWIDALVTGDDSEYSVPAVPCEFCDRPISPARLAAAPGSTRCVGCESATERGGIERSSSGIICPRCGATLCWRVRRTEEPSKYFLGCTSFPACRYTEE